MTPLQLHRETPIQRSPWPQHALTIVAGAAIAMFVAVVLLAWQASHVRTTGIQFDVPVRVHVPVAGECTSR
jgi:hypothetical protein